MNRLCPICDKTMISLDSGLMNCQDDDLYASMEGNSSVYDDVYLLHYKLYARTKFSEDLQKARWDLVRKFLMDGTILDFGCGAGAFGALKPDGFEIYQYDPYFRKDHSFLGAHLDGITFWDSLEHMQRLEMIPLLEAEYIFVGLPITDGIANITNWKHFHPHEHIWYFSKKALVRLFNRWGYSMVDFQNFETALGRVDIISFIFHHN